MFGIWNFIDTAFIIQAEIKSFRVGGHLPAISIRTTKHSLKNCIDCHITPNAKGEYARYSDSKQHFCASCHEFAAVKIDCFMCHADRPGNAVRESIMRDIKDGKNPHISMQRDTNELILNADLLSNRE